MQRLERWRPVLGITRVANVTGLDSLGLPVVMVCRPNARSLSVSQGKGLTLEAAKASGLMESLELYHAERIQLPVQRASFSDLRLRERVASVDMSVPSGDRSFYDDLRLLWIAGHDLLSGEITFVPYECVHMDMTVPLPEGSGRFRLSSNGLASGNHPLEAVSHALCEVIERDALSRWKTLPGEQKAKTRLSLKTVDDADCQEVLHLYNNADLAIAVWEVTSEIGIPVFHCQIVDRQSAPWRPLGASQGTGCHPTRAVALLRALTEAAQARLTLIVGSRDDLKRRHGELRVQRDIVEAQRREMAEEQPTATFSDAPNFSSDDFASDVQWLLERLQAVGCPEAVAIDLTLPGIRIPVVRVVVPGLRNTV